MKKNGLLSIFSITGIIGLSIFSLTSCSRNQMEKARYEVMEGFNMNYDIGDRFDNVRFDNMHLRRHHNGHVEQVRLKDNFEHHIDYETGMLRFRHSNHDIEHRLANLNYISTSEELKGLENKTGLYVLKSGTYNVEALTFNNEIALIGSGKVKINVKDSNASHAITFTKNSAISNIKVRVENQNMYAINVDGNATIKRFHMNNINIKGSRGVILRDVTKSYIDNSKFKIDEDLNEAIFNISCGSDVVFTNCKLRGSNYGSVKVLGNENCDKKNNVEFINTEVEGNVHVENYDLHKSEIVGLDWVKSTVNNTVTYIKSIF